MGTWEMGIKPPEKTRGSVAGEGRAGDWLRMRTEAVTRAPAQRETPLNRKGALEMTAPVKAPERLKQPVKDGPPKNDHVYDEKPNDPPGTFYENAKKKVTTLLQKPLVQLGLWSTLNNVENEVSRIGDGIDAAVRIALHGEGGGGGGGGGGDMPPMLPFGGSDKDAKKDRSEKKPEGVGKKAQGPVKKLETLKETPRVPGEVRHEKVGELVNTEIDEALAAKISGDKVRELRNAREAIIAGARRTFQRSMDAENVRMEVEGNRRVERVFASKEV